MEGRTHRSKSSEWREFYKAALFEDDNAKIPQRIAEAERALATRARELFGEENQIREQQAMENATYFLRLLRKIEVQASVPCEQLRSAHASCQQSALGV
jgi:hypothetical protein